MFRIAICEPNLNIANNIETMIDEASKFSSEIIQCDCFGSGKDFFDSFDWECTYRIIYINLDMVDTDGITIGQKIREQFSSNETLLIF